MTSAIAERYGSTLTRQTSFLPFYHIAGQYNIDGIAALVQHRFAPYFDFAIARRQKPRLTE